MLGMLEIVSFSLFSRCARRRGALAQHERLRKMNTGSASFPNGYDGCHIVGAIHRCVPDEPVQCYCYCC